MVTPQSTAPMMAAARIWRGVRKDLTPSRIPNLNAILLPNTQTSRRKGGPFECGGEASAFEVAALRPRYESGGGLGRKSGSFAPALKKKPRLARAGPLRFDVPSRRLLLAEPFLTRSGLEFCVWRSTTRTLPPQ